MNSGVKALNKDGDMTWQNVHLVHHYFGANHDKHISDSEGGLTKTHARVNVTNMSWTVDISKDLCDKHGKDVNFTSQEPTDEERVTLESDPSVRGTWNNY